MSFRVTVLLALLLAMCCIATSASAETTEEPGTYAVVATGSGETAGKATEDAIRNAVEQAVGALIDAKTLIEGEQVLEDKVLRVSGAFVESYDIVRRWSEGGLLHCKVSARVRSRELRKTLAGEPVFRGKLEGKNLGAQIFGTLNAKTGSRALLKQWLEELRDKTWFAKVNGTPQPVTDVANGKAVLDVPLEIGIDMDAWASVMANWTPRLSVVALASDRATISMVPLRERSLNSSERYLLGLCSSKFFVPCRSGDGETYLHPSRWVGQEEVAGTSDPNYMAIANEIARAIRGAVRKGHLEGATPWTIAAVTSIAPSGLTEVSSFAFDRDVVCAVVFPERWSVLLSVSVSDQGDRVAAMRRLTFPPGVDRRLLLARAMDVQPSRGVEPALVALPGLWTYGDAAPHMQVVVTAWRGTIRVPLDGVNVNALEGVTASVKLEPENGTSNTSVWRECR